MKEPFLEVTFRHGRALAAYYSKVTLAALNRILRSVGVSPAKRGDLAPVRAA